MLDIKEIIGEDYTHSANSLFHFMSKETYLINALRRKALCPRYCIEDIKYLNIAYNGESFEKIAVLQKCFCDIPLGSIVKKFAIHLTDNNTEERESKFQTEYSHTDIYGQYALALSKKWGEENKLQPVHYMSQNATNVKYFSHMFHGVIEQDDVSDILPDALISWMCFMKPLRGTMCHRLETKNGERINSEFFKNFHDEHEWRFVPDVIDVDGNQIDNFIANAVVGSGVLQSISDKIEDEKFKMLWLPFQYEDIRYIIVPDSARRQEVIKAIQNFSDEIVENYNGAVKSDQ